MVVDNERRLVVDTFQFGVTGLKTHLVTFFQLIIIIQYSLLLNFVGICIVVHMFCSYGFGTSCHGGLGGWIAIAA